MRTLIALLAALFIVGVARAASGAEPERKKPNASDSRAEQVNGAEKGLLEWLMKNEHDLTAAKKASKGPEEVKPLWEKLTGDRIDNLLAIAEQNPTDDVAFGAAQFVLDLSLPFENAASDRAFNLIARHHAGNPKVVKALNLLRWEQAEMTHAQQVWGGNGRLDFLRAVLRKNPEKQARGMAAFMLAQAAQQEAEGAKVNDVDIQTKRKEAIQLFQAAAKDFGDVQLDNPQGKIGDLAKHSLKALLKSPIGKPAVEIEGEDLEGKNFKLSDYRGKVVLLDFWGSWCGPCMYCVPQYRATVARFQGRPFVLIGVNSDKDRDKPKKLTGKESVNWRSFWNGKAGARGPISRSWEVNTWPTLYLIDHKGIVRRKFIGGATPETDLNRLIDDLVGEVERSEGN
jgi:thiol-disulfide isomerase/thioredoxin